MLQFKDRLAPFAVGRRIDSEEWNAITRTYEAADGTVRLPFGSPVKAGTVKHSCVPTTATSSENFLGITEAMPNLPRLGDGYARYDNVPILEWGVIAVAVTGNVTAGAIARWDNTNKIWTAAAQSVSVVTIPGCTFEETATAPGITPVRLRRPNPALTISG